MEKTIIEEKTETNSYQINKSQSTCILCVMKEPQA